MSEFTDAWHAWRERREATLTNRHGFLAITSINWLTDSPQRFPDAPGEWWSDKDGVEVALADGEHLTIDGRDVTGVHHFGPIPEGDDLKVGWGDAVIEVATRGGSHIVRPRHPGSQILAAYRGTPAYAPRPQWVIAARFVAADAPRTVVGGSVVDGLMLEHTSPGTIEFEVAGQQQSLVVFSDGDDPELYVLFTDRTSGVTTYRACRILTVGVPAADGSLMLDFNRASNLPCAYTPMATCPLPPPENRLGIAVEAGEMLPL